MIIAIWPADDIGILQLLSLHSSQLSSPVWDYYAWRRSLYFQQATISSSRKWLIEVAVSSCLLRPLQVRLLLTWCLVSSSQVIDLPSLDSVCCQLHSLHFPLSSANRQTPQPLSESLSLCASVGDTWILQNLYKLSTRNCQAKILNCINYKLK